MYATCVEVQALTNHRLGVAGESHVTGSPKIVTATGQSMGAATRKHCGRGQVSTINNPDSGRKIKNQQSSCPKR